MLSKCANPECSASFHYLGDGRLFQLDAAAAPGPRLVSDKRPAQRIEYFWLCGECATTMTLIFQRGRGVMAVPLHALTLRRAAAS